MGPRIPTLLGTPPRTRSTYDSSEISRGLPVKARRRRGKGVLTLRGHRREALHPHGDLLLQFLTGR